MPRLQIHNQNWWERKLAKAWISKPGDGCVVFVISLQYLIFQLETIGNIRTGAFVYELIAALLPFLSLLKGGESTQLWSACAEEDYINIWLRCLLKNMQYSCMHLYGASLFSYISTCFRICVERESRLKKIISLSLLYTLVTSTLPKLPCQCDWV